MKKVENVEKQTENKQEKRYTKDAVLKSKKFAEYRDVLAVKLQCNKLYTMQELEDIVKKFR